MEHLPQTVRYCRRFCYKYGVLAIIASADDPESIEDWAKSNHAYLKHYLELPHGIPSHDTFQRVLEKVKPNSFQKCFNEWIEGIRVQKQDGREHIAVDGKENRRSKSKVRGIGALHIVIAFSCENGISLGQIVCAKK